MKNFPVRYVKLQLPLKTNNTLIFLWKLPASFKLALKNKMNEMETPPPKTEDFCLKWSNYQAHVLGVLVQLLQDQSLVDVTLCASGGEKLFAHKIILCAASSYFEEIFANIDDSHPVVILGEVEIMVLRSILEFVYHGELNVHASQLKEVLDVAASLQIRGLTEVSDQLPLLVPSNDEVLPLEQDQTVESSYNSERNDLLPGEDGASSELVLDVYQCDADSHTLNGSEVTEYVTSSMVKQDSFHNANQEESFNDSVNLNNVQLEHTSLVNLDMNCSNGVENWDVEPSLLNQTQKRNKRKRRESCRKEYSEEQLAAALTDLRAGHLLGETAATHSIPRSTLYVKAKVDGIPITVTRQEHSGENVNAAVQAVNSGASLQQASDMYQIPKTVLWRKVRAAGLIGRSVASKRHTYGSPHRQAAVQALQNGQNLSKVSAQFQIPKTTLFREKARLIEAGKLPWTSLKRRETQSHSMKLSRLKEAVAACKEGKMSQAVASITYQVPKTTIWRRLRKGMEENSDLKEQTVRSVEITNTSVEEEASAVAESLDEQTQFSFIESNEQIPVTYIVEEDFTTSTLII